MYIVASRRSQVASAILDVGESTTFEVSYQAAHAQKSQGEIRLSVVDNQYEDCVIHLVAEAYQDDVTIGNVTSAIEVVEDADDVTVVDNDVLGRLSVAVAGVIITELIRFAMTVTHTHTHTHTCKTRRVMPPDKLQHNGATLSHSVSP